MTLPHDKDKTPRSAVSKLKENDQKLIDLYNSLFDVHYADQGHLRRECYRLRYQVYCLETEFENKEAFVNDQEIDIYDPQSISSLLYHKSSETYAGTVRLILPNETKETLPALSLSDELAQLTEDVLPRGTTAEISRFAISKQFRRRHYDTHYPGVEPAQPEDDRRIIPTITLGLLKSILSMSLNHNITHWTVVMEPALHRLLRILGIKFKVIGPIINYHGKRQVMYNDLETILSKIKKERPDIFALVTEQGRLWS